MSGALNSSLYQRIYAQVRQIPAGRVSSYGRIARLIGTTPRTVGFALAALPPGNDVPWQRVINSRGAISPRPGSDSHHLQRDLLSAEGVSFNKQGLIDLDTYGWPPHPDCG